MATTAAVIDLVLKIGVPVLTVIGGIALKNRYDVNKLKHYLSGTGMTRKDEGIISRLDDRLSDVEQNTREVDGKLNLLLIQSDDTPFESFEDLHRENWNDDYHYEDTNE